MSGSVLFVDNDQNALHTLKRLFEGSDYQLHFAKNSEEALRQLSANEINIVVTELHLPVVNGYDLLKQIKDKYPVMINIILSGCKDESMILDAIRKNYAKLFIYKPLLNERIVKIVSQVFSTEGLLKQSKLLDLIRSIDMLPVLKGNYQSIMNAIEQDGEMDEISRLIEMDQSVALEILKIANSAFYGVKTGSVKQAISFLGLTNIKNIILSTSVIDALNVKSKVAERLWQHSFMCNKIVSMIYGSFLNKKLDNSNMAAGLLHDVGKAVLIKYFGSKYLRILDRKNQAASGYLESEIQVFGVCHQIVGGYLLKWWELPYPIVEAALYHHSPSDDSIINRELVSAVHIADFYSWKLMNELPSGGLETQAFENLGFTISDFDDKLEIHKKRLMQ